MRGKAGAGQQAEGWTGVWAGERRGREEGTGGGHRQNKVSLVQYEQCCRTEMNSKRGSILG